MFFLPSTYIRYPVANSLCVCSVEIKFMLILLKFHLSCSPIRQPELRNLLNYKSYIVYRPSCSLYLTLTKI